MNRHLAHALGATALGALLLQPVKTMADPPAYERDGSFTQHRGGPSGGGEWYDERRDDRGPYRPGWRDGEDDCDRDHDHRWDHDRDWDRDRGWDRDRDWDQGGGDRGGYYYAPRRGDFVDRLPSRYRPVYHDGRPYYYAGGAWYRPYGRRYVVVDPPLGMVVSFLPQYTSRVYFGGVPYYRCGPVYYVWHPRARGYLVTDRPYRRW